MFINIMRMCETIQGKERYLHRLDRFMFARTGQRRPAICVQRTKTRS